jgi:hypothetical protein
MHAVLPYLDIAFTHDSALVHDIDISSVVVAEGHGGLENRPKSIRTQSKKGYRNRQFNQRLWLLTQFAKSKALQWLNSNKETHPQL